MSQRQIRKPHHCKMAPKKKADSDEPDAKDIQLPREQAQIPVICVNKRQRKRGRRAGCLLRTCRRSNKPPLPSILLANVQSLENKITELRGRLNYQRDIKNCNILCFTESWLNDDNINIQLAGYTMYRLDRTAAPDIHALWPHPGQIEVARRFRTLLDSDHHPSEIAVLAMELLAACQGIELFHPLLTTTPLEKVYDLVPQCNQSPG
ncbi:uncharacterized protein ACWYII_000907 isoform 1-T7 [Salvelinus alpinus]